MKHATLLLLVLVTLAARADDINVIIPSPVITGVPGYLTGTVTGAGFAEGSVVWVRPVTTMTSIPAELREHLLASNDGANRIIVSAQCSVTACTVSISPDAAASAVNEAIAKAFDRTGVNLSANDLQFRFQVERPDGERSEWK